MLFSRASRCRHGRAADSCSAPASRAIFYASRTALLRENARRRELHSHVPYLVGLQFWIPLVPCFCYFGTIVITVVMDYWGCAGFLFIVVIPHFDLVHLLLLDSVWITGSFYLDGTDCCCYICFGYLRTYIYVQRWLYSWTTPLDWTHLLDSQHCWTPYGCITLLHLQLLVLRPLVDPCGTLRWDCAALCRLFIYSG